MRREKSKLLFVCAIVLLLGVAPVAQADWDEGDPHKMHYPQLPDPCGYDVSWQFLWALGDDWQCSETGPVEDIHFWVSFEYGMGDPCDILNFNIEIWSNNPGDTNMPWSHPNEPLWIYPHPTFTWRYVDTDLQGWFDPNNYYWLNDNHTGCWQINIENIPDPFIQEEGEIYWLVINDVVTTDGVHMGWKESNDHFMDDAVWLYEMPWWEELYDPETPESMDLAFVITAGEATDPNIKWSQPPVLWEPPDIYIGWDEPSLEPWSVMALDDFRCDSNKPVTAIRWWGSLLGWYGDYIPPDILPDAFYISIWTDTPASAHEPCEPEVKWTQWPDTSEFGFDLDVTEEGEPWYWAGPEIAADDFECYMTGPITDITIWGSWVWDILPEDDPTNVWFTVSIHANNPLGPGGYSEPIEPPLWIRDFYYPDFDVSIYADMLQEGYWIPCEGIYEWDSICWQYDFSIDPCDAFVQQEGEIYWLDVQAHVVANSSEPLRFGWKTSVDQWNDYAVWACGYKYDHGPWEIVEDPMTPIPLDLAFMITTQPEGYSHPKEIIWETYCETYDVNFYGWEYDPQTGMIELPKFEFYQEIPPEEYWEQPDDNGIYWLGIMALYYYESPEYPWGWETRPHYFMDDAVRLYYDYLPGPGVQYPADCYEPIEWEGETWDLSFELISKEEPEPDFGDAPEDAMAYPSLLVFGAFPTCMNAGPAGHVQHTSGMARFEINPAPGWDAESDGDAGLCPPPGCFPPYDQDECFSDGDAGLMFPEPYTINAAGSVVPCPQCGGTPLGTTCQTAVWGVNVDIFVVNNLTFDVYVNVLMDWDQDGRWYLYSVECPGIAWEHVLKNFVVPAGYAGPLSGLGPPNFVIGPNPGYIWTRFSVTEVSVPADKIGWNGEGTFEYGETEDYLLLVKELDFGDAPDPTYPTLAANSGANHIIVPGVYLGQQIDAELDGQPTVGANGDDANNLDDEDGVTFLSPIIPGTTVDVNVVASANGFLSAWFDFNADGDWDDAILGENIFAGQALNAGGNALQFNIPMTAPVGKTTYSRWRFVRTSAVPSYRGQALDGEVEDYIHEIKEPPPPPDLDYGDAPDPTYPTLAANSGANHIIVPGVYLGQQIDAELDGQPTVGANGDDANNLDDEDGVTFLSPIIPWTTVDVNVVASANGFLSAWFDLNADGDWDDAGENIFAGQALNAGGNALQFNIPATAPVGKTTYSRWRFVRTSAVPSYRGQALDGEVEDYIHEIKERPPKPLIKHSKWSQPPIELDPNSDIPVFCGWDELSFKEPYTGIWFDCWDCLTQCHGDADCDGDVDNDDMLILAAATGTTYPEPEYDPCADFNRDLNVDAVDLSILLTWFGPDPPPADCQQRPEYWMIAADDFRCLGNMPITSIHFWGSHYGWDGQEPGTTPPVPPIAWRIGFWSNVPAQGGTGTDECTWNPGDPYKMHYPQEPKPGGWNVAFNNSRLADDWKCSESGPVSDIHFWVSWKGDNVQPIDGFSVRIHSDIPAVDSPTGYSIPAGDFLWERDFYLGDFTVRDMPPDWQGWFDPYSGEIYPDDHTAWQQIDICKILDPFHQEEGTIYWLEIDFGPLPDIGWKESGSVHFNDDAVRWESPQWMELRDPFTEESLDLAFVITTEKYSHPEKLLWQIEVDADRVEIEEVGTDDFHHYHPNDICYQYNLTLEPNEYFRQGKYLERTEDSVFWLSIAAIYPEGADPIYPWGWKTRPWHWMDDAVRIWHEGPLEPGTVLDPYSMEPIKDPRDPEFGKSFDLAFELDTDPNYIKWEQHYTGIRHWPHYEDEPSLATVETFTEYKWLQEPDTSPNGMDVDATDDVWRPQLLADDFPCEMTGPIDRIHIWGSWFHDRKPSNDANMVAFTLSIHADIPDPDGKGPLYSMPGQLLWRRDFYPGDFVVDWYADIMEGWYVPCAEPPLYDPYADTECWMYMFPIPPTEAFWQEQGNIYWLDVQAKPMLAPHEPLELVTRFGWKNTNPMNHFSDDAVWAVGTEEDGSGVPTHGPWNEMRYPLGHPWEGQSVDMAFEIFTYGTKYMQPPEFTDINSIDIDATRDEIWQPQLLADDFNCTTTEPITDIHIWGSWYHDFLPYGDPGMVRFKLSIHKDIPADESPTEYSMPGELLWEKWFEPGEFDVNIFAEDLDEGYYVPCSEPPYYERIGDHICWQYDFYINESEAFVQEGTEDAPVVYWLNVQAVPLTPPDQPIEPMRPRFGWKTTDPGSHWNDDAVWAIGTEELHSEWQKLRHPESGETLDLAFAITTSEKELVTHRQVADDWKCERHTPVTATAWWGSYLGFEYWACHGQQMPPPEKPDYFLLTIWDDVPADPNDPLSYSHPNDIIWEYKAYDYDEVLVGYDKHPHDPAGGATGPPREAVFRYSVQIPETNWFRQKDVNGVYWFSVVAVYEKPLAEIEYPWGWTNHEHVFNDDAVEGYLDISGPEPEWIWEELYDQTGISEDMSFILYTEPGCFPSWYTTYFDWLALGKPNCWCGIYGTPPWPYQCDGDTNRDTQIIGWRVYTNDLTVLANNWKKTGSDPTLNPCADIDHKGQIIDWRVYTNDLGILATNWKKLDIQLPGNCPRPE